MEKQVWLPPYFQMKGGGAMNTYQTISLMIMFGMLLISLISLFVSFLQDNNKGKK